jgi:hypothetical protein
MSLKILLLLSIVVQFLTNVYYISYKLTKKLLI